MIGEAGPFKVSPFGETTFYSIVPFQGRLCADAKRLAVSDRGSWPNYVLLSLTWQGQCGVVPARRILTPVLTLSIAHSPFSPLVAQR